MENNLRRMKQRYERKISELEKYNEDLKVEAKQHSSQLGTLSSSVEYISNLQQKYAANKARIEIYKDVLVDFQINFEELFK